MTTLSSRSLRLGIAGLAVFAISFWTVPSFAFRMIQNTGTGQVTAGALVPCNDALGFTHWANNLLSWRLNLAGQGSNKSAALEAAMLSWTNVASADHVLSYAGVTTAGWAVDGTNTVLWANGNGCTGGCLALTALVLQTGQVLIESDITFNSNYTWNIDGNQYDTQAVATHEFGHALGIHHSELGTAPLPTMYASYFGTDGRTLETDDISALQCSQSRYPFPATSTPASLTVTPELCYGFAFFTWSTSTFASYYELQRSYSSTYSSPITVYSGPNTYFDENGGTGTKYYRVRACNLNGCSGWRNGNRSVGYYFPCR